MFRLMEVVVIDTGSKELVTEVNGQPMKIVRGWGD